MLFNTRKTVSRLLVNSMRLNKRPLQFYQHIKDMEKEAKKAQLQKLYDEADVVETYPNVHKPSYTLELDRCGELLVYSADPLKAKTIYFKYPYVFFESFIPLSLFGFLENPFNFSWQWNYLFLVAMNVLWMPRAWYFYSLQFRIRKMWLLRGGKYVKMERTTLAGDTFIDWAEIRYMQPITEDFRNYDDKENSEFLTETGQLKYELGIELEHFMHMGTNAQDVNLFFVKEGIVHHPEVFDAIVRGYHIDTTDFVINTGHNERSREPHYNY